MSLSERQQREKQHRIETILESAKHLFARKGFQETSMTDIARQAELGKATLYYYFKSKDDIYREIFISYSRTYYSAITEVIQNTKTVGELIEAILMCQIDQEQMDRDFLSILYPIGRNAPVFIFREPEVMALTETFRKPIGEHIRSVFRENNIDASADLFQKVMWSFMTGLAVKMIRGYNWEDLQQEVQYFKNGIQLHITGKS